jgi:hypothetical protein
VSIVLALGIPIALDAQVDVALTLYAVSGDSESGSSHIWEIDTAAGGARLVLTLPPLSPASPRQAFSTVELQALNTAIETGGYTRSNPDTPGIAQRIQQLWLVDDSHLLLQTTNEVCDRPNAGCFGYHEFLIADIRSAHLTSLWKLDYHPTAVQHWAGCDMSTSVGIDTVSIHPSQEKFAFTLKPASTCLGYDQHITAFIVDYTAIPVTVRQIDQADGLAWSADGRLLAYYTRTNCTAELCDTSILVASTNAVDTPTVIQQTSINRRTPLFTAWTGNNTLLYQWPDFPSESSETTLSLVQYSLRENTYVMRRNARFLSNSVYQLDPRLIGIRTDQTIVALPSQSDSAPVPLASGVRQAFYNQRYNDFVLVNLDIQAGTVEVITETLQHFTLNLSDFFTAEFAQTIYAVTPGAYRMDS